MRNPDGVLHLTGVFLAERIRAGHDPRNPKVLADAVDVAELVVNEVERRFEQQRAEERAALPPLPEPISGTTPPV